MLKMHEVAKILGVPYQTALILVKNGHIPHFRFLEKIIRVSENDLKEFLASCKRSRT